MMLCMCAWMRGKHANERRYFVDQHGTCFCCTFADDDSKEVVDLKYLQRNNTEQMQKLYNLWKEHPAVLYVVGATTPRALCFSACACR